MTAIEAWRQRVAAHTEQLQRAQDAAGMGTEDLWEPLSTSFKADPRRTDDAEVQRLLREVTPSTTLIDVGGGAGRFALPLALHCQHVTVVEPSASMGESLRQLATEAGIGNISLVASRWEDAEVAPADVVLSAHVIYSVVDIEPFVRKLVVHARTRVLMPTFVRPPMARFAPFWRPVHGEAKHDPPGLVEFMQVLWDMGIYPDVEMFPPSMPRPFRSRERALEMLRLRLCVIPGSAADARLQEAMRTLLVETPEGYVIKDTPPGRLALISW